MQSKNTGKTLIVEDISIIKSYVVAKIGSKKLRFTLDTLDEIKLSLGDEISLDYFQILKERSKFDELYLYAIKILNKDGYTSFEINKKLWKKGASLEDASKIVGMLSNLGLLDDYRYAINYVKDIGPYKGIGKNKIIYNLMNEGISIDIINELEFKDEDELKKATTQVEKLNKQLNRNPDKKKKEKVLTYLISYGFDYEIANKALAFITPNDKNIMRKQLKLDFETTYLKLSKSTYGKDLARKISRSLMNKGYEFEEILDLLREENLYEDD